MGRIATITSRGSQKIHSNDIAIALQRGIIPHRHWINTIIAGTNAIASRSKSPLPSYSLAPYEDRFAAAQSVKVMISILGLELG
jgi:hypothetical protein